MVAAAKLREERLDEVFHALSAHPRRQILARLKRGPTRVTDIAQDFDVSLNSVSKHIKVLERAQLIRREVRGRVHLCSANEEELAQAEVWIRKYREFWTDRLQRLNDYLSDSKPGKKR